MTPRSPMPRIASVPAAIVMVVLGSAGLLKLADLNAFRNAIESWTAIPNMIRPAIVLAVPVFELSLAGLWFARIGPRLTRAAGLCFLIVTTSVYLGHAVFVEVPDCGCFGLIAKAEASHRTAIFVVARNSFLIGLLLISMSAGRKRPVPNARCPQSTSPTVRTGFTILETIVVIAIVGLLVSLLMPTLGQARQSAERLRSRASLGQHARVVSMYLGDWDDEYPIYADHRAMVHIIRSEHQVLTYRRYFDVVTGWNVALADLYYDGRSRGDDFQRPGTIAQFGPITPYKYSSAFLAQPEFWNPSTRTGPDQWSGVRDAQVRWPSAKVVFLDSLMWDQTARPADPNYASERNTDISLIDGSARRVRRSEFTWPYVGGEGSWRGSSTDWGRPGLHTLDGVAGHDIK
ncbi:MAG: type II secretion system protein [Planctomycetota bacterium]|nr:type II secretion system protein [Planctomycetota bacterium]